MRSNKYWATSVRTLAVVAVTLIVTLVLVSSSLATEYKVLYTFRGPNFGDGKTPIAGLAFDAAGDLYGTTLYGGANACHRGCGTVFKLTPSPDGTWTERVLYGFDDYWAEGVWPRGGVIVDTGGNLYGTVNWGGNYGAGAVFKLSSNPDGSWTESLLHSFWSEDGQYPEGTPISDRAGNLYGTTSAGGVYGHGTVFSLTPNPDGSWVENVLYSFTGGADGAGAGLAVIFDDAGNLYGTTVGGGASGYGTVFKLSPDPDGTWTEIVLHSFQGTDGGGPYGGLTRSSAGNLYGATIGGGFNDYYCVNGTGCGVVFELTSKPDGSWKFRKLHAFKGRDGGNVCGGLTLDKVGNVYGMTWMGGTYHSGTVFRLAPQPDGHWQHTKLHQFRSGQQSYSFTGYLAMDAVGNLYGTTSNGGKKGHGLVFRITP